jgi:hypothetical protein
MKKNYVMIVGIMLFLTALPISTAISEKEKTMPATMPYTDELDQNQSVYIEGMIVPIGRLAIGETVVTVQVAQSFIPTKELLTRVQLFAGKNTTTSNPLVVGIRDNLTHENLVETSIPPGAFVTGNFSWVDCDFDDLWVTLGKTYYIVTKTKNVTDNWYVWGANNHSDAYVNGCAWVSIDNGSSWNQSAEQHELPQNAIDAQRPAPRGAKDDTGDMCFRTYGLQETPLAITTGGTFLKPLLLVKNTGSVTTYDVQWRLTVTGGILHLINTTAPGTQPELAANTSIELPVSAFGFGPLVVTLEIEAMNAQKSTVTKDAFILLIFIFWK